MSTVSPLPPQGLSSVCASRIIIKTALNRVQDTSHRWLWWDHIVVHRDRPERGSFSNVLRHSEEKPVASSGPKLLGYYCVFTANNECLFFSCTVWAEICKTLFIVWCWKSHFNHQTIRDDFNPSSNVLLFLKLRPSAVADFSVTFQVLIIHPFQHQGAVSQQRIKGTSCNWIYLFRRWLCMCTQMTVSLYHSPFTIFLTCGHPRTMTQGVNAKNWLVFGFIAFLCPQ